MTTLQTIVFYISFFIAVAIVAFPRVALRNHPKLTGEEIAVRHSHLQAVQYKYNLPLIVSILVYFLLLVLAGSLLNRSAINEYLLFFPIILFLGIYDGYFALTTGVFPATSRWNFNRFVYAPEERYRRLAGLQVALALVGTLVSLILSLHYPM